MPRPCRNRKLCTPPKMKGFKPFGIAGFETEPIILHYDEFESLRLVNYDNQPQETAAEKMNISRPTLTRIYNRALKKIAQAFVEGRAIIIEGGQVEFEKDWYRCKQCHKLIEGLENHKRCTGCNHYNPQELIKLNADECSESRNEG